MYICERCNYTPDGMETVVWYRGKRGLICDQCVDREINTIPEAERREMLGWEKVA